MVQPESMDVFPRKERRHFIRTFPPSCREGDRPVLCVAQLVQNKPAHSVRYVVFADLDICSPLPHLPSLETKESVAKCDHHQRFFNQTRIIGLAAFQADANADTSF